MTPKLLPLALGLTNNGSPQLGDDGVGIDRGVAVEADFPGQIDSGTGYGPFAGRFVEGQHGRDHAAGGVRNVHHIEIGLQVSVFPGGAVNDDQGIVEVDFFALKGQRKVVAIQVGFGAIRGRIPPAGTAQHDAIDIIACRVQACWTVWAPLRAICHSEESPPVIRAMLSFMGEAVFVEA